MKEHKAFTLSEVLITLGIIGVVVALTLPALISRCQHYILVNRAKKAYSTIYQAYYKSLSDLEFQNGCFYQSLGDPKYKISDCNAFKKQLLKNLKVVKYCEQGYRDGCIISYKGQDDVVRENYKGTDVPQEKIEEMVNSVNANCSLSASAIKSREAFVLSDGLTFVMYSPAYFIIDTNGTKGPNKWGYDVFLVIVQYPEMKNLILTTFGGCTFVEKGGKYFDEMILE